MAKNINEGAFSRELLNFLLTVSEDPAVNLKTLLGYIEYGTPDPMSNEEEVNTLSCLNKLIKIYGLSYEVKTSFGTLTLNDIKDFYF
jgi:hypothetical protein